MNDSDEQKTETPANDPQRWLAERLIPHGVAFWAGMQERYEKGTLTESDVDAMVLRSERSALQEAGKTVEARLRVAAEL